MKRSGTPLVPTCQCHLPGCDTAAQRSEPGEPACRVGQRTDLLLRYASRYCLWDVDRFARFRGLPAAIARRLLTGPPNVDPDEGWGDSPPMLRMVDVAELFGGSLHGFAILPSPAGARPMIAFEGLEVPIKGETLEGLFRRLGSIADCFDEVEPGVWRLWWDEESHSDPEEY